MRTRIRSLLALVAASVLLSAGPVWADGPGYGGEADQLHVSWTETPAAQALGGGGGIRAVSAAGHIPMVDPGLVVKSLQINGVGFRAKSAVELRVGSGQQVEVRTDSAGALEVVVPPDLATSTSPGTTIVAIGRNMSGTQVTLLGSVPPLPDGNSVAGLVPWLAAGIGIVSVAWYLRRMRADDKVGRSLAAGNSPKS